MQTKHRYFSLTDKLCIAANNFLKTISYIPHTSHPGSNINNEKLNKKTEKNSISMLKQNHAGEVCAQALYQAQNLFNDDRDIEKHLYQSCQEEWLHLSWCNSRLQELNAKPSILTAPIYLQAYALGCLFSIMDKNINLGFIATYEDMVVEHLDHHLCNINADMTTKAIFSQMQIDETQHSQHAIELGGTELSAITKNFLKINSKIILFLSSIT